MESPKTNGHSTTAHGDWKEQSRYFLRKAVTAHNQMFELREQAEADEDCQAAYDLALAAFSVYDHLWGQSFLRTEETLLAELKELLADRTPAAEAYQQERFLKERTHIITELIAGR